MFNRFQSQLVVSNITAIAFVVVVVVLVDFLRFRLVFHQHIRVLIVAEVVVVSAVALFTLRRQSINITKTIDILPSTSP